LREEFALEEEETKREKRRERSEEGEAKRERQKEGVEEEEAKRRRIKEEVAFLSPPKGKLRE